jgi:uncharacterized damage-inducible protein DinB
MISLAGHGSARTHSGDLRRRKEQGVFDLDEFLHHFERVRERTRRVAACIPRDRAEWTYAPEAFTLGDLVRHIAVTERFIWAETVHHRQSRYVSHGRELADGIEAILAFLDRMHEESVALFRMLSPDALAAKCETPDGARLTTWKWLRLMPEHEIHHRGQIYTMLGMLGVATPPLYGMTAAQVRERSAR